MTLPRRPAFSKTVSRLESLFIRRYNLIPMTSILGLVILVLDIIAIIDCVKGRLGIGKKLLWILLIILLPVLGMILYFLLGRK